MVSNGLISKKSGAAPKILRQNEGYWLNIILQTADICYVTGNILPVTWSHSD